MPMTDINDALGQVATIHRFRMSCVPCAERVTERGGSPWSTF